MPNATIRDVAREAAVSVASVSRVLNGHANVRPALRTRIETVAAQLGYVPHAGARNLSMARAGAIGVVLPDLHGEYFSELLRGMDREASARGLQLLLTVLHADTGRGIAAIDTMRGRVDGLIVMAPQVDAERLRRHLPPGLPAVLVNCARDMHARAELRIDNQAGAESMIDHLVATGRRRIVHITGPADNIDAIERRRGVAIAAERAGVTIRYCEGDFLESGGIAAAMALLADRDARDTVDAIFAANDMMAIGAMTTLKRAGIAVPGQIAVAGFDDIPLARLIAPALTTMGIDIAAFGARAMQTLARIGVGEQQESVACIAPTLIIRETTDQSLETGHHRGEKQ